MDPPEGRAHRPAEMLPSTSGTFIDVIIDKSNVKYDTFRTRIEVTAGMVNRQPLTKSTSNDLRDLSVLAPTSFITPGIFMNSLTALLPPRPVGGSSLRSAAAEMQAHLDALWKHWVREYVVELQRRQKWFFVQ